MYNYVFLISDDEEPYRIKFSYPEKINSGFRFVDWENDCICEVEKVEVYPTMSSNAFDACFYGIAKYTEFGIYCENFDRSEKHYKKDNYKIKSHPEIQGGFLPNYKPQIAIKENRR